MGNQGWRPTQKWEQNEGGCDVHPVWYVEGPAPFGGLRAQDEEHAAAVCMLLNLLTGRESPQDEEVTVEPDQLTEDLAEALRAADVQGVDVQTSGTTIIVDAAQTYDVPAGASCGITEDGVFTSVPCVLPGDDATKMTAEQVASNLQQHPQHGWRFRCSEGAVTFDMNPATTVARIDVEEGPLFSKRASVEELRAFFTDNGLWCARRTAPNNVHQAGRLDFQCGAVVNLYRTGKAAVQGRCTEHEDSTIRQLLRVALWKVKDAKR